MKPMRDLGETLETVTIRPLLRIVGKRPARRDGERGVAMRGENQFAAVFVASLCHV